MKIICTGAAGFIGYHTVKKLLDLNYEVVAIDIKSPKFYTPRVGDKLEQVTCNLLDPKLEDYIEKGDKILHLGAIAHFIGKEETAKAVQTNVLGTLNVIQCARKKGAERIVYSSTGSVYSQFVASPIREDAPTGPSTDNYYGWSKLQAEDWLKVFASDIPYVILRYPYVYGTNKDWGAIGKWLYHDIPDNVPPLVYGGKQANDFTYVKDIVNANIMGLETEYINNVFNIGTGKPTSILRACNLCLYMSNSKLQTNIQPARSFDYSLFYYDIQKARLMLKYEPLYDISSGTRDMVELMRKNPIYSDVA